MATAPIKLNLARKYRPSQLSEVLGQEIVVKALGEALKNDRIGPAYLFSGPRGTGKTSSARIFAKAAACLEKDLSKKPCRKCASCLALEQGRSMDLIEIDGASHTGVDDVRSIVDAVVYKPNVGARTIYIIDEVHMLSKAAFNALLKTLEEPPPHVLFLFATTEVEKIPETILSRVQRLELRRLRQREVIDNLQMICKKESIKAEASTLEQIASASEGCLRDAQNLLEQSLLLSGGLTIAKEVVDQFLGTIGLSEEVTFLEAMASQNPSVLIQKTQAYFGRGKDLKFLMTRLVDWLRTLLILRATSGQELDSRVVKDDYPEEYLVQALKAFEAWSLSDLDQCFEILWQGRERLQQSDLPKIVMETTFLKISSIAHAEQLQKIVAWLDQNPVVTQAPATRSVLPTASAPSYSREPRPSSSYSSRTMAKETVQAPKTPLVIENLDQLIQAIRQQKPSLYGLLACKKSGSWDGQKLSLVYPKGHFAFKQLSTKSLQTEIVEIIKQLGFATATLEVSEDSSSEKTAPTSSSPNFLKDAKAALLNDPEILRAQELLKGKVSDVTIEGVKN